MRRLVLLAIVLGGLLVSFQRAPVHQATLRSLSSSVPSIAAVNPNITCGGIPTPC